LANDLLTTVIESAEGDDPIDLMMTTLSVEDGEEIDLMLVMKYTKTDSPETGAEGIITPLDKYTVEEARVVADSIRDIIASLGQLILFLDDSSDTVATGRLT